MRLWVIWWWWWLGWCVFVVVVVVASLIATPILLFSDSFLFFSYNLRIALYLFMFTSVKKNILGSFFPADFLSRHLFLSLSYSFVIFLFLSFKTAIWTSFGRLNLIMDRYFNCVHFFISLSAVVSFTRSGSHKIVSVIEYQESNLNSFLTDRLFHEHLLLFYRVHFDFIFSSSVSPTRVDWYNIQYIFLLLSVLLFRFDSDWKSLLQNTSLLLRHGKLTPR